jgi:hypothetical protein
LSSPSAPSTIQSGCHSVLWYVVLPKLLHYLYRLLAKIGAIAAGNCFVLKPSELSPATSGLIAELVPKYMDPDVVRIVLGAVPETTKVRLCYILQVALAERFGGIQLLELPWDHSMHFFH